MTVYLNIHFISKVIYLCAQVTIFWLNLLFFFSAKKIIFYN